MNAGSNLVASIPKDHLRSLFYLFTGKPDSRIKIFQDPVQIGREDIIELNDCISRKLATHHIDAIMTSVRVGYEGSQLSEFGTWPEFSTHHWQEPEVIEEIVVKWDFLVNVENYAAPQRHTLLVRISRDMKPGKFFQMLGAGNADELEQLDMVAAPAFCRVDFINAQISKELINVVADWYKARRQPELIPAAWYWLKKRRQTVAEVFDHWLLLSWALLLSSVMLWLSQMHYAGAPPLDVTAAAIFFAVYTLRPASRVTNRMASRVFKTLANLEGSRVVFEFTSGDKKRIVQLEKDNKRQGHRFVYESLWNIAMNLAATALYTYLFVKSAS
jgi:hypothetical protein